MKGIFHPFELVTSIYRDILRIQSEHAWIYTLLPFDGNWLPEMAEISIEMPLKV